MSCFLLPLLLKVEGCKLVVVVAAGSVVLLLFLFLSLLAPAIHAQVGSGSTGLLPSQSRALRFVAPL